MLTSGERRQSLASTQAASLVLVTSRVDWDVCYLTDFTLAVALGIPPSNRGVLCREDWVQPCSITETDATADLYGSIIVLHDGYHGGRRCLTTAQIALLLECYKFHHIEQLLATRQILSLKLS